MHVYIYVFICNDTLVDLLADDTPKRRRSDASPYQSEKHGLRNISTCIHVVGGGGCAGGGVPLRAVRALS